MAEEAVVILGADRLRKEIEGIVRRTGDLRPAWPVVNKYMTVVFRRQFDTEGRFLLGQKWRDWSPAWAKKRPTIPGGNRGGILRHTNVLWGSFTNPNDPNAEVIMDPLRFERGSKVPYAQAHQRGKRVPERAILTAKLPKSVELTILKTVSKYAVEGKKS